MKAFNDGRRIDQVPFAQVTRDLSADGFQQNLWWFMRRYVSQLGGRTDGAYRMWSHL